MASERFLREMGSRLTRRRNIPDPHNTETAASPGPRFNSPGSSGGTKFMVDFNDGKVTLDVSNGDLEDVVRAIAEQSDAEIITYGSLKSEINAKLNDVPLTEALALLLGAHDLRLFKKTTYCLLATATPLLHQGRHFSKSELIHLGISRQIIYPQYFQKIISDNQCTCYKRAECTAYLRTSEDIVQAREFLKTIDIPTPQVRIDAVIVEFKENLDKEFGIRSGKVPGFKDSSFAITPFPEHKYYKGYQHFELGMSGKFIKELWKDYFPEVTEFYKEIFT